MTLSYLRLPSPVGRLTVVATDRGLAAVLWENDTPGRVPLGPLTKNPAHPILRTAVCQLEEYFSGQRRTFSLPLDASGTPFQNSVWQALSTIPYGETRSYADLAFQIGRPKAARAVGAANGRNPLSLVVPCHRVLGSGGHLIGFAGGLKAKAWLLEKEATVAAAGAQKNVPNAPERFVRQPLEIGDGGCPSRLRSPGASLTCAWRPGLSRDPELP